MESNFFVRRIKGLFPILALAVVAVVAVTTAMTVLGNTQADATPSPSGPPATPTIAPIGSPSELPTDSPTPLMSVPLPSSMPVILTVYHGERDPKRIWFVVWRYPQFRNGSTPLASVVN